MRLRLVLAEAVRSIGANVSTSVAATVTVLIGMFLLGLFIALGTWMLSWTDHVKKELVVNVYFCTPSTCASERYATGVEKAKVAARAQHMPEVKLVRYVSKERGLELMRRRAPELVRDVATNPLPDKLEIVPAHGEDTSRIASKIEQAELTGIEAVKYGRKSTKQVLTVARAIELVFLIATLILLVASTLLIANTIRLSIFARRREIEVMKLVGATNWFVRGPFMLEGLICGLAGALFAVLLLLLGKEFALPAMFGDRLDAGSDVRALEFTFTALIIIGAGLILGAAGSGLTLRRFLRV
jgi:cell division transport system permease protein